MTNIVEWFNIKDKLPERDGLYLVYRKPFGVDALYYMGHSSKGSRHFGKPYITHWAYLPEPPIED